MPARRSRGAVLHERLHDRALALPEAHEDHPWGETVVKVGKKVFVFLGTPDGEGPPGFGVKLAESLDQALALPGAAPMGYGLGKAGWVTVRLDGDLPPEGVLLDWVEESYRAVAPKRLVAAMDDSGR
ncbi:MAG: MmcQ/YjbR family DNA-binding protein [Frankiaceae bacterium]